MQSGTMAAVLGKFGDASVDSILAPNVICGSAALQPGTTATVLGKLCVALAATLGAMVADAGL